MRSPAEDKRDRMLALHERLARNDVFVWADRSSSCSTRQFEHGHEHAPGNPPPLPVAELVESYRKANKGLLLLDYDGTLVPLLHGRAKRSLTRSSVRFWKD